MRTFAGNQESPVAGTLETTCHDYSRADSFNMAVASNLSVRRLTPTECDRLQGFPDGFTQIPWRNKPTENCPDGPRYKALGNSMAVPVMRWIGERIHVVRGIRDVV
jgi:site-specific DNA-cytosine methylase